MKEKIISIITGGAGFFGQQIFQALMELKHHKIIIIDNNKKNLTKFEKKFNKYKKNFSVFNADITSEHQVKKVNDEIIKKFKKIDILVNNAAIDYRPIKKKEKSNSSFFDTNLDSWTRELDVGLTGAMLCSKIFCKIMVKKRKGIVLNIASDLSVIAPDQRLYKHLNTIKPVSYSVVKHGLIGFTKYLSSYLASKNIRVNALSPGGIKNKQDKYFINKIKKLIPMNRMANINEYKEFIKFLCSDKSTYLTGHNIVVDGGRSII